MQRKQASRTYRRNRSPIAVLPVTYRLQTRPAHQALADARGHRAAPRSLKAEGKDIIGLGAGEPDFDTPVHIADAGVAAIRGGHTRYTAVEGTNELKDAIIAKFSATTASTTRATQILVSSGAKQTVFNLMLRPARLRRRSGHPRAVLGVLPGHGPGRRRHAGHSICRHGEGYKITPAQLEAAITPKTRLFILNSPSNPTGAAYTRAELERSAPCCEASAASSSARTTCTSTSSGAPNRSRAS